MGLKLKEESEGTIVLPRAHHFVFLTHEADVLREMNAFVTSLKK